MKPLISMLLYGTAAFSLNASTTASDDFQQGLAAYEQGRHALAFVLIRSSAEQGKALAQYHLGTMYRGGIGVAVDEGEAFAWYKKAAENGLLEAQFQLGLMYYLGDGVKANQQEAIRWLGEAADRGYPQAGEVLQYVLSSTYDNEYEIGC